MVIVIPNELTSEERRVAVSPDGIAQLIKLGFQVRVEHGAGIGANFTDKHYSDAGAEVFSDPAELFVDAKILLKVNSPSDAEIALLKPGATTISFFWPAQNPDKLKLLAEKEINVIAIDSVPRISRAQKMDALSTMANIGGYRAVIEAANRFGRFLTGQITAAGKIPPAKVLVIGAGVAGLSAIGTAKSMGAIVRAFDTRPEVKEQITSMGGEFLSVDIEEDGTGAGGYAKQMSPEFIAAEMALFREQAKEVDIVITTALIPGKPAPKLWMADAIENMKEGSIVVDMAAEQGGNCELTEAGKAVIEKGVTIIGYTNLASRLSGQASRLYGQNLIHLLEEMTPKKDGNLVIDMDNEVIRGATVVKSGEVTWPPPAPKISEAPPPKPQPKANPVPTAKPAAVPAVKKEEKKNDAVQIICFWAITGVLLYWLGRSSPPDFLSHFMVFALSIFIGWQVVWNVSHSLHTPLMSVTNAISGIITDEDRHVKMAIVDKNTTPVMSVNDSALMMGMPASLTAATGMDALTHAVEAYVSTIATPVTDCAALKAVELIGKFLRRAVGNGDDREAREQMAYAQLLGGMAFNNASLGFVHAMAHQLGGFYDLPHGVCNAVLLPHVQAFNARVCPERLGDVAAALGENIHGLSHVEAAEKALAAISRLSADVGIPAGLAELGVKEKDFETLANNAMVDACSVTNPKKATHSDIVAIFKSAM